MIWLSYLKDEEFGLESVKQPYEGKQMTHRYLYLIRHGHYDRDDTSSLGGGLTSIGKDQARVTGERVQSLPVSSVHFSTLRRAVETAEIILPLIPGTAIYRTDDLCEVTLTSILTEPELRGKERADRVYDKYMSPVRNSDGGDQHELVVCHGNLIRYFVCRALFAEPESLLRMVTYHCGVSQFRIDTDGRTSLVSYNDVGHLPLSLRTED